MFARLGCQAKGINFCHGCIGQARKSNAEARLDAWFEVESGAFHAIHNNDNAWDDSRLAPATGSLRFKLGHRVQDLSERLCSLTNAGREISIDIESFVNPTLHLLWVVLPILKLTS